MEHYFGEKLKKLREERNWTQADLAKRFLQLVDMKVMLMLFHWMF